MTGQEPGSSPRPPIFSDQPLRIAVVGYGYWGPNLVRNLRELGDAEVAAVCDRRTEALDIVERRYPDVLVTTELNEVLADETIDAVRSSNATPRRSSRLRSA